MTKLVVIMLAMLMAGGLHLCMHRRRLKLVKR
jgi:hypothetical protein